MYALDRRGRRVNLRAFVSFKEDGWDKRKRYQFDDARNLALVHALMTDGAAEVQWLFIAAWLKERLIARAWAEGLSETFIARMDEVLHQPGDSNPHSEHLHLRVYCSKRDRLHGCLERGPIREWADLGDEQYDRRVANMVRVTQMSSARWRKRGAEALGELMAYDAVPRLLALLADSDRRVRKAALAALKRLRDPDALAGLATHFAAAQDSAWAATIFRAMMRLETDGAAYLARQLLTRPRWIRAVVDTGKPLASMRRAAIRLLSRSRDPSVAPILLSVLAQRPLKKTAHAALRTLTNQPLGTDQAGWRRFLDQHGAKPWLEWMRLGLRQAGHAFERPLGWDDIDRLIPIVAGPDKLASYNASRALSHITGYDVDPRHRTLRNNHRLWRSWRRGFNRHTGPAEETRQQRYSVERITR